MTMPTDSAAELPPWEDASGGGAAKDKAAQDGTPQDKAAGVADGSGAGRWVLPSLCSALELLLQVLRFFSRRKGR